MVADVVNGSVRAMLLTALGPDHQPLGSAAIEPAADHRAEVRYRGVGPTAWGQGIATLLLRAIASGLRGRGYLRADLWVYDDNDRAITVYESRGWQPDGPRIHRRSGTREPHYGLDLGTPDSRSIWRATYTAVFRWPGWPARA